MSREQRISRQGKRRIINRYPANEKIQKVNKDNLSEVYQKNASLQKYIFDLNEMSKKGADDLLPFFINHPPIQGYFNILSFAEQKVEEIYRAYDKHTIEPIKGNSSYDLVTILPYRGRYLHLTETIKSLVNSANLVEKKIGFIVIENSISPTIDPRLFEIPNLEYRHLNSNGKIFNKCICHNIGVAISNSDFVHFHDCDLVVPSDFYSILLKHHETHKAIQCFSRRRVNYINEETSLRFFNGEDLSILISNPDSYRQGLPGAPGGSISVSRELFLKCGGFDPHFFWAYSIEDKFFWRKLERYVQVSSLDNPAVELYHMWHPPGWGKNPYERFEQRIYQLFDNDRNWQDYINKSIELYNKTTDYLLTR